MIFDDSIVFLSWVFFESCTVIDFASLLPSCSAFPALGVAEGDTFNGAIIPFVKAVLLIEETLFVLFRLLFFDGDTVLALDSEVLGGDTILYWESAPLEDDTVFALWC